MKKVKFSAFLTKLVHFLTKYGMISKKRSSEILGGEIEIFLLKGHSEIWSEKFLEMLFV